jgi:hypothetical protein
MYNLKASHGYRGVLIEAVPARFRELQSTFDSKRHLLLNALVGFTERDCLDTLLPAEVPKNVDLLSIDIDGNDYHAWAAMKSVRPKLVVIEFNPTIANAVHFV